MNATRPLLLRYSLLFMLPALLFVAVFEILPIFSSFYYSAFSWDLLDTRRIFVGFQNFVTFFRSEEALGALKNTIEYAVIVSILKNLVGLLLALALDAKLKTRNILRVCILSGAMVSLIISGYTWSYILHPELGVGHLFKERLGLSFLDQDWLGNPHIVLFAIMIVSVWQITGKYMIIYLAGLQTVPVELHDAARVDGAGGLKRFLRITMPLMMPAITVGVLNAVIQSLKVFDEIFAMTKGGPGFASETLSTFLYNQAFFFTGQAGFASAIAVIQFLIVMVFSGFLLLYFRREESQVYG